MAARAGQEGEGADCWLTLIHLYTSASHPPEYRNHSRRDGKNPVEIWTSFVKQIIFLLNWNVSTKQHGSTAGQNINHLLTIYEFQFPGTSLRPNWSWMMLLSVSPKMLIKCVSGAALVYTIDLLSGVHVWDISRISSDSDSETEPAALLRCPTSIQPNWARYILSRNVSNVWQCQEWRVQYLERVPSSHKTSFVQLNSTTLLCLVLSAACSFHHCCCCQLG